MTLREQLLERRRQWREANEWEAAQPPAPMRDPSRVLADLSWLLSLVPPDERNEDPDPDKIGIQKMRAALAKLR